MPVLDINPEPMPRLYTHHLFLHAILSGPERTGPKKASVRVVSGGDSLRCFTKKMEAVIRSGVIDAYAGPYEKEISAAFYRPCKEQDEMTLQVLYQQKSSPYGGISLFVSQEAYWVHKSETSKKGLECAAGKFCTGEVFFNEKENPTELRREHAAAVYTPYFLRIKKDGNRVTASLSPDGARWDIIGECRVSGGSGLYIGLSMDFDAVHYYHWLFTNYIQLFAHIRSYLAFDYLLAPQKLYNSYTFNPLLSFFPEKRSVIESAYASVTDYLVNQINVHKYVELVLDEYFIPERLSYQSHYHSHHNLIYGYEGNRFYLLGVRYGKPVTSKASFEEVENAYASAVAENNTIFSFGHAPDKCKLDIPAVRLSLENYLNGTTGNKYLYNFQDIDDCAAGIQLYDYYCGKDELEAFIQDSRIAYLLCEHKSIMLERLEYLYAFDALRPLDKDAAADRYARLLTAAKTVLGLVLKNAAKPCPDIREKISRHLMAMKALETEAAGALLAAL